MTEEHAIEAGQPQSQLSWSRDFSAVDQIALRMDVSGWTQRSLLIIDLLDAAPVWARLREDVDRASRLLPRMRQRVVIPALPVTWARLSADPDFDLDYHLRRICLPQPGGFRQLLGVAQTWHAMPLDMSRPLWEATLVDGLGDGAAAIVWKLHSMVLDGAGERVFEDVVRSRTPDGDHGAMPPIRNLEDLTSADLTSAAIRKLPWTAGQTAVRSVSGTFRAASAVLGNPRNAVGVATRLAQSVHEGAGRAPAPPSPLLRRRSRHRRFEMTDIALTDLHAAACAHNQSVNDAFIAAVCGGLRSYHERRGVPVAEVSMAMSTRRSGDDGDPARGQMWCGVRINAPVGEPDPVKRIGVIRERVVCANTSPASAVLRALSPAVSALLPDALLGMLPNTTAGADVVVSGMAGYRGIRYLAGQHVCASIPFGPRNGAAVTLMMYPANRRCYIGINLDPAAFSDPQLFMLCLREGLDEVSAAGRCAQRGGQDGPAVADADVGRRQ